MSCSISPDPPTVNENARTLTFTVSRTDSTHATTVYVSTVEDEGFANNGYCNGFSNQALSFSAGQSSAKVRIGINDLGLTSGSQTFRMVVQQSPRRALAKSQSTTRRIRQVVHAAPFGDEGRARGFAGSFGKRAEV